MKKRYTYIFFFNYHILNIFFHLFILFQKIEFSFNVLINNIIELGGEGFRFSHFSLNSKGDMIIDTTSFPGNNERRFYGIKRNGRPYFFDENNIETPYRILFAKDLENTNQKKTYAESNFIILSKQKTEEPKEYLLSFSGADNYIELYDFDNNKIWFGRTTEVFGNTITSEVNTFIKSKSTIYDNYNYYVAYNYYDDLTSNYRIYLGRIFFTSTDVSAGYHIDTGSIKTIVNKATASCFETELKRAICFYQNYINHNFDILTLNEKLFNESYYTRLMDEDIIPSIDYNHFFKAIHFKQEIGIFVFFISESDVNPIISVKYCEDDNLFYDYKQYSRIILNKMNFNSNAKLNDIMKLNDNMICYISCSEDKNTLIIVTLFFYDNDNYMMQRYYKYEMFTDYQIKFFKEIRAFYFNNYISLAFSHCSTNQCSEDSDQYYSSLIIFNYPNSPKDQSVDLIEYIYSTNKQIDTYTFRLNQEISCNVDNNIFNYACKGIKLLNYPETMSLLNNNNRQVIEKNTFLDLNEYLSLEFQSKDEYKRMNYTVEYAFIVIEPEFAMLDNYAYKKDNYFANNYESNNYIRKEFTGRSAFFNLTIKEDMTSFCNDKCSLCYKSDNNSCTICKYNYTFNEQEKICYINPLLQTTILAPTTLITTVAKTTIPTTLVTTVAKTTIPTTLITTVIKTSNIVSSTVPVSTSISTVTKTSSTFLSTTSISSSNIQQPKNTMITSSLSSSTPSYTSTFKTQTQIPTVMLSSSIKAKSTLLKRISSIISKDMDSNINEYIKCINQQVLDKICLDIISNEQIKEIYEYIKGNMINNNTKNNNTILQTKNAAFQVSTVEQQKNNYLNISSVDLGECEDKIREKEKIKKEDKLLIYKIDTKNTDMSLTYVQYEIYNPYTLEKIPLDICESNSIIIKAPIDLDDDLESIYISLNTSGYNLFNLNDSFYTDICSTYTTQKGTDISMADRKNIIYDNYKNATLCQSGCSFLYYDYTNKKSECQCNAQTEETITNIETLSFNKEEFIDNFYKTLKNSNFLVMKCYELIFSLEGIINNYGSYLMSIMTFIFFISFFCYCIKGPKFIDKNIFELIHNTIVNNNKTTGKNSKERIKKKKSSKSVAMNKKKKVVPNIQINHNKINIYINDNKNNKTKNNKINNKNKNNDSINKKKNNNKKNNADKKKKNNYPPKRNIIGPKNDGKISSDNLLSKGVTNKNKTNLSKLKISRDKLLIKENNNLFNKKAKFLFSKKKEKAKTVKILINDSRDSKKNMCQNLKKPNQINSIKKYSDIELNLLTYEQAIIFDHRTYFQYYNSLIHQKHLLLFTFCRRNDYNLTQLKICLLLLNFSLQITISGFFFSDKSMNKIYQDNGEYDLLFQIPQILYSFLSSAVINAMLKWLSLTEHQLISLKQFNKDNIIEQAKKLRYQLIIRIAFFFIIGIIYMLFFWYYISCFCAVYKNTQLILIIDSLLSLGFSLIYQFGLYLLPGMFRITALRAKQKNKKCLFLIGNIMALL